MSCLCLVRGRSIAAVVLATLVYSLFPSFAAAAPRHEVSLNGVWEYQKVADLEDDPKAESWKQLRVPGTLYGWNYERAWLRRSFELPASIRGQRIKIRFDGVKYNSRILVNGKHVGGCFNGYDAFEVDVTDAVRFDGPNELRVGCHDWTGVFSEGKFDFSEKPDWQRPRRYVADKVIAPIGGHYAHYGVWADVTLVAHPAVYVKDLFIKPSVRQGELVVEYTLANESDDPVEVELQGTVEDRGDDLLQLPSLQVEIPPRKSIVRTVRQKWADARYWSHEDPYLYHLRTELSTGDVQRSRFGFREFWVEGHRFVLNGSKVNLLATSWWPPTEAMERDEIRKQWEALKAAGVTCFRTHTQPWRRVHYEVADEVGLLMIVEGAMWHDPHCTAYQDPTYWDNYAKMIRAMMSREKNSPSVIMWSMENEAYSGVEKTKLAVENFSRIGKLAKSWDPTRPIYFESDGDPGGVSDAIGMHYVCEYPQHTCWPNDAYWLTKPFLPRTWYGMAGDSYVWKKDKPVYIGEFLWVPSGTPAGQTVFFGDDAYLDMDRYVLLGKAEAWKMQILAFRSQEAGGMCPWTVGRDELNEKNPLYQAHQHAYQPIAAFCHDYDRRFYSGKTVKRRLEIFNDILSTSNLTLEWTLSEQQEVVDRGEASIALEPGEKQMHPVTLRMPKVESRTPLTWRVTLRHDGKVVFDEEHDYSVFAKLSSPHLASPIGLFDPNGTTAQRFTDIGIPFVPLATLDQLPDNLSVLVLGAKSLDANQQAETVIGRINPKRAAVNDFVDRGGRVLVLRQDAYPEGLFDTSLAQQQSTMTFPLREDHPALNGVAPDDLKFWRGDHLVADHELPRPTAGAAIAIVASGSKTGISYVPLFEQPKGKGCLVHCQLKLIEKALLEPAAGLILTNLLEYLDRYQPQRRRTALLGGDASYRDSLRKLGLRFDDLSEAADGVDLTDYSLVICRGAFDASGDWTDKLGEYVRGGGNLYVHRPAKSAFDAISLGLNLDLQVQPFEGDVQRAEGDHPLQQAISREDLYWTIKQPGMSWVLQPLAQEMSDGVFLAASDSGQSKTFRVTALTQPKAVVAIDYELGRVVLDNLRWDTEPANGRKAARYACSLLTALGADFTLRSGVSIECEQMTPQPGAPWFDNSGGIVSMGSNAYIKTKINVAESRTYEMELVAAGDDSEGVGPLVEVHIDGQKVDAIQLTIEDWRAYPLQLELQQGQHEFMLKFVNDHASPSGDRNLRLDKVSFYED